MPTNRTRITRAVRSRVTDEARAIYAEAPQIAGHASGLHSRRACGSASIGTHCSECLKYIDLSRELGPQSAQIVGIRRLRARAQLRWSLNSKC